MEKADTRQMRGVRTGCQKRPAPGAKTRVTRGTPDDYLHSFVRVRVRVSNGQSACARLICGGALVVSYNGCEWAPPAHLRG